jgi:hypothetical protein
MQFPSNWDTILNGVLILSAVINFFSASFFWKMRATFATQDGLTALEAKMDARLLERDKEIEAELDEQEKRIRLTEVGIATMGGEIKNVGQIMTRVEHQVSLLVEYRMYESKAQ